MTTARHTASPESSSNDASTESTEETTYWIIRRVEDGEAIGVVDEPPPTGIRENACGVWTHIVEQEGDGFLIKARDFSAEFEPRDRDYEPVYKVINRVLPITKAEYETYIEMGLFND